MTTYYSLIIILVATIASPSTSSDHYLLSCGAPSSVANTVSTYDSRTWHSDNNSTFSNDFSTVAAVASSFLNVQQIPFATARIFTSNCTYSFSVSPGPKFIRLFFYPSTYFTFSSSESYLTLRSNTGHILLRNFSAYLSKFTEDIIMFKEFYVNANSSLLQLTFSPTPPSSHVFLNGIEIVSVPDTLYVGPTAPIYVSDPRVQFYLTNSTALETAYRLNVGGAEVSSMEDSGSMGRQWVNDEQYLTGSFYGATGILDNQTLIKYTAATPNYTAPAIVYQTFRFLGNVFKEVKTRVNMTWGFEVDLGFYYLLRLHWCEVVVDINATNYRVFNVYVNGMMAEEEMDIFAWVGADTAVYRDYVVYMDVPGGGSGSRGVLQVALHPNTEKLHRYLDILLNGLEIFKLDRSDGSLDAPNPSRTSILTPNQQLPSSKSPSLIVPAISYSYKVAIVGVLVLLFF